MNANRLINRIIRRFTNQAITKGIDMAARKGRDPSEMTEAERKQAKSAQKTAKNARRAMRATRKLGRF